MKKFYHISPENFNVFRPKYGRIFKCKGIYVCPNFYSLITDWSITIANRHKKKNLIIYTLSIPKDVITICEKIWNNRLDEELNEDRLYSFWLFGKQLFIPEEYVSTIKIIGRKKYSVKELNQLYSYICNKKWEQEIQNGRRT